MNLVPVDFVVKLDQLAELFRVDRVRSKFKEVDSYIHIIFSVGLQFYAQLCNSDGAERTDDGRAFHARAAVTGKAQVTQRGSHCIMYNRHFRQSVYWESHSAVMSSLFKTVIIISGPLGS